MKLQRLCTNAFCTGRFRRFASGSELSKEKEAILIGRFFSARWGGIICHDIFYSTSTCFFFDFHLPCRGKAAWLAANQDLKQDPAYGKKWILDNVFVFRHQTISPFLTIFARNFQSRISRDFCRIFDLLKDPKKSGPKKKRWAVGEVVDEIQDPRQLECS